MESFEWDAEKDFINQVKHGVGFAEAQYAFADSKRVIAKDLAHSTNEQRYFCFGRVGGGILTVRFTYRQGVSGFSGRDTGARENGFMSKKIKYTDGPIGPVEVVEDFLPPPEDLAFSEETVKVTITLSQESVDFFKREAKKHNTQYQRMIRRLLDAYTRAHR